MQKASNKRTSDEGDECSAAAICVPPLKQATLSALAITQRKVNALIVEFIIGYTQAFSLVKNSLFRKMIEGISGERHLCARKH